MHIFPWLYFVIGTKCDQISGPGLHCSEPKTIFYKFQSKYLKPISAQYSI